MTQKDVLAYLAGAIDSDGTIGIKKSTYAMRVVKDSNQPTYSERIELRQVTPQIPDLLKRTFGGCIYKSKGYPIGGNGRPLFAWQLTDRKAAECLKRMIPFLRVKAQQALNALILRTFKEQSKKERVAKKSGHIGSAPRSARLSRSMEHCYQTAKMLNKVGR